MQKLNCETMINDQLAPWAEEIKTFYMIETK